MGSSGMGTGMGRPLVCPECGCKVAWNGTQYVCLQCPWTEHKEKPPSSTKVDIPKEIRDRKQADSQ
jgi:hypothetical protein